MGHIHNKKNEDKTLDEENHNFFKIFFCNLTSFTQKHTLHAPILSGLSVPTAERWQREQTCHLCNSCTWAVGQAPLSVSWSRGVHGSEGREKLC